MRYSIEPRERRFILLLIIIYSLLEILVINMEKKLMNTAIITVQILIVNKVKK